jgi:hypothetical protein
MLTALMHISGMGCLPTTREGGSSDPSAKILHPPRQYERWLEEVSGAYSAQRQTEKPRFRRDYACCKSSEERECRNDDNEFMIRYMGDSPYYARTFHALEKAC